MKKTRNGKRPEWRKLTPEMEKKKWKPGQSGNPSGRQKGRVTFEALVRKELAKRVSNTETTKLEMLAIAFVNDLITKRAPWAVREFLEREWPVDRHLKIKLPEDGEAEAIDVPAALENVSTETLEEIQSLQRRLAG